MIIIIKKKCLRTASTQNRLKGITMLTNEHELSNKLNLICDFAEKKF